MLFSYSWSWDHDGEVRGESNFTRYFLILFGGSISIINSASRRGFHFRFILEDIVMTSKLERRSSVLEYEQTVLFGQYHEKLASFARLQSHKMNPRSYLSGKEWKDSCFCNHLLHTLVMIGNWPLLIFMGFFVALSSFVVDLVTVHLLQRKNYTPSCCWRPSHHLSSRFYYYSCR